MNNPTNTQAGSIVESIIQQSVQSNVIFNNPLASTESLSNASEKCVEISNPEEHSVIENDTSVESLRVEQKDNKSEVLKQEDYDESEDSINRYFTASYLARCKEQQAVKQTLIISDDVKSRYKNAQRITDTILQDITVFTEVIKRTRTDPVTIKDCDDLARVRCFPKGFFLDKGILYSKSKYDLTTIYPELVHSSVYLTSGDVYEDRYLSPITTLSNYVYTFMGYHFKGDTMSSKAKYELAGLPWVGQNLCIGNLGSFTRHTYNPIKVCFVGEGNFDAYRAEQLYDCPAICLFGSELSSRSLYILRLIKRKGYVLCLLRDNDISGKKEKLVNNPIWDNIMISPGDNDIDRFVAIYYRDSKLDHFTPDFVKELKSHFKFKKDTLAWKCIYDKLQKQEYRETFTTEFKTADC